MALSKLEAAAFAGHATAFVDMLHDEEEEVRRAAANTLNTKGT